jgi:hypothetical protein
MNSVVTIVLRLVLGVAGLVFMLSLLVAALVFGLFLLLRAWLTGQRPQMVTAWQRARSTVRPPPWADGGGRWRKGNAEDVMDVEAREPGAHSNKKRLPPR